MNRTGKLKLELVDVHGGKLAEKVDIYLRHQTLSDVRAARAVDASKTILITNLLGAPQGLYRVEIDPPSYLPVSRFVNLNASGETERTITFPVDPEKVIRVDFPTYGGLPYGHELLEASDRVLGHEGIAGEALYKSLDDLSRAGLLNILAKCHRTRLSSGCTVLSYVRKLMRLRGDRFYAAVPRELREDVRNGVSERLFNPVDGSLHRPPPGFANADSFKTPESFANLQITFFTNGSDWVADIDIDEAGGLRHAFEVMRNRLRGRPTHPYDIHQLLIHRQELDPGYRLVLYEQAAEAVSG